MSKYPGEAKEPKYKCYNTLSSAHFTKRPDTIGLTRYISTSDNPKKADILHKNNERGMPQIILITRFFNSCLI